MTDVIRHCYRHPNRETGLSCSECGRPICYECMTPAPVGLRCPEHSGRPQGVQRVARTAQRTATGVGSRRINGATMALIAINVGVYLAELAIGGSVDGQNNWIYFHGALYPPLVATGDWWRLVTSAFLHFGPFHLLINMYSLYYAGTLLEHVIGRWRFVLLYVASGVAGSAGAVWLSPNAVTVGASGAIFGILGALFVLERNRHIATGGQVAGLIVLNLVFTFAISGISVGGHLGGLVAGVILMWALMRLRRNALAGVAAGVVLTAISFAIGIWRARGHG